MKPSYIAGRIINGVANLENSMAVFQKVKQLPYDLVIPLPGIYTREIKTLVHTKLIYECS